MGRKQTLWVKEEWEGNKFCERRKSGKETNSLSEGRVGRKQNLWVKEECEGNKLCERRKRGKETNSVSEGRVGRKQTLWVKEECDGNKLCEWRKSVCGRAYLRLTEQTGVWLADSCTVLYTSIDSVSCKHLPHSVSKWPNRDVTVLSDSPSWLYTDLSRLR